MVCDTEACEARSNLHGQKVEPPVAPLDCSRRNEVVWLSMATRWWEDMAVLPEPVRPDRWYIPDSDDDGGGGTTGLESMMSGLAPLWRHEFSPRSSWMAKDERC